MAADPAHVTRKVHHVAQSLVTTMSHDLPISKKRYLNLVRALADKDQKTQLGSDATTQRLSEKDEKIGDLKWKAGLWTDDYVTVVDWKKQLVARGGRIAVSGVSSRNLNTYLLSTAQSHGHLRMEIDLARAAIAREVRVNQILAERVCRRY